jgi:hypothetical protein
MQKELDAFKERFPAYCLICGGTGYLSVPATRDQPEDGGPCSCVESGHCPLCAQVITFEEHDHCDYGACGSCGWNEWNVIANGAPMEVAPEVDCCCDLQGW